jgi:hypothetical protein
MEQKLEIGAQQGNGSFPGRRRQQRFEFDSVVFPLIGSKHPGHSTFQYMPMDISGKGLKIALPAWLVSKEFLETGDRVDLHVPFLLDDVHYHHGRVRWRRWDDSLMTQTAGIEVEDGKRLYYPIHLSLRTGRIGVDLGDFDSLAGLARRVLKDCRLLKKGVAIYLKHMIPYFYRVGGYPRKEYARLKEFIFDDFLKKIQENEKRIEAFCEEASTMASKDKTLSEYLDLEEFRAAIESEIHMDILTSALDSLEILPYVQAIKKLEQKLYFNYNTIVMVYLKTI